MSIVFLALLATLFAGLFAAPCPNCPCAGSLCVSDDDCCTPALGYQMPNASVCVDGHCWACAALNTDCFFQEQCQCNGTVNATCLTVNDTSSCFAEDPSPCGFCPCLQVACATSADCCDPGQYPFNVSSVCTPENLCSSCVAPNGSCTYDVQCQCNDADYQCYGGDFPTCQPAIFANCTLNDTLCTADQYCSPDLEECLNCSALMDPCVSDPLYECNCSSALPGSYCREYAEDQFLCTRNCTNNTDCPFPLVCGLTDTCFFCLIESGCCANNTECAVNQYCSINVRQCLNCSSLGEDCSADPTLQCACDPDAGLTCDPTTLVCVAPRPPPTRSVIIPIIWAIMVLLAVALCCCCLVVVPAPSDCDCECEAPYDWDKIARERASRSKRL